MAAPEYLLEAERVTVAGGLVGGRINILRMFRREVFGVFVMMKSARMRKKTQQFLVECIANWMRARTQTTSHTNEKQLANA